MIGRMWKGANCIQLKDSETGRTFDVYIMGATLLDPIELEEIILGEVEIFAKECKKPLPPKPKMSKNDQHDLGKVLVEIQESKRRHKVTGNPKYFQKG